MISTPINFDRITGHLEGVGAVERGAAVALRLGAQISGLFAHRGYSLGCRLLSTLVPRREITVHLDDDTVFAFPFGDGYWSKLLDRGFVYEPEIATFLLGVADVDYTFIDCGANFGLWSVLVTSRLYGRHPAIAIEPSIANAAKLLYNARLNGDRFSVMRKAIGASSGGRAMLCGRKHEALSIAADQASGSGEEVEIIALDSLIETGMVAATAPIIVKLDVEGVEIDALKGGDRLLKAKTIVICEEHGRDRQHSVTRYALAEAAAHVFVLDPTSGSFVPVVDLAILDRLKTKRNVGYNVFITKSRFWEERLRVVGTLR